MAYGSPAEKLTVLEGGEERGEGAEGGGAGGGRPGKCFFEVGSGRLGWVGVTGEGILPGGE